MFDIFYTGSKPNRFLHEQPAESIEQAMKMSRTRYFWWITYLADLDQWDWLYEPPPWQSHQRHAWPSQHQRDAGVYLVPKNWNGTDTNYHDAPTITRLPDPAAWDRTDFEFDYSWHPDPAEPSMHHQFGTQWQRTGGPRYCMPGAKDVKYEARPRVYKTSTDPLWRLPPGVEFGDFDFTWHPDATDPPYIYQFPTQHQRTGGPQYVVPGAVDIKFVDQIRIKANRVATAIVEIDHLDGNAGQIPGVSKTVRYFDNYRDTLIRIAKSLQGQHEFVWICSSICDYTAFDFSWHPDLWQATMLHVFASDEQKFGDTFFMHVPSFVQRAENKALLEWTEVNYIDTPVPRRLMPVIQHNWDSQADAVKNTYWPGPLALFTNTDYVAGNLVTVPLWRTETKNIVPLSTGATSVIVPKVAKGDIRTQLYDYAFIDKTRRMLKDDPLDIVFISNGEPNANTNLLQLQMYLANSSLNKNQLHVVSGVNGRAAAYHAAAKASTTPWFFAVFAKLEVNPGFDWSWQPDRMQQAKHYIFYAENPVNGLVYGHQAMIAYNKKLVLDNPGVGLDFTLDSPHEVVPIVSGVARYNTSPWSAWRTAFREVLKLKAALPDVEAEYRINQWLTGAAGFFGQWSVSGAEDAVEYYNEVGGDFEALKKSYEWAWLASYALLKRNLTTDQ